MIYIAPNRNSDIYPNLRDNYFIRNAKDNNHVILILIYREKNLKQQNIHQYHELH